MERQTHDGREMSDPPWLIGRKLYLRAHPCGSMEEGRNTTSTKFFVPRTPCVSKDVPTKSKHKLEPIESERMSNSELIAFVIRYQTDVIHSWVRLTFIPAFRYHVFDNVMDYDI